VAVIDNFEPTGELLVGPNHRHHAIVANARLLAIFGEQDHVIPVLLLEEQFGHRNRCRERRFRVFLANRGEHLAEHSPPGFVGMAENQPCKTGHPGRRVIANSFARMLAFGDWEPPQDVPGPLASAGRVRHDRNHVERACRRRQREQRERRRVSPHNLHFSTPCHVDFFLAGTS
jgi:hypothetical protein